MKKIIDSLCYLPTMEVILDLIVSLPPQMARYLKNVFGPLIAPLIGLSAEELYQMKMTLSPEQLRQELTPRIKPLTLDISTFVTQLDEMGVEKAVIFNLDE